jgi:hypothetical protein
VSKVSALAIHVHILLIKTRPAFSEGFAQDSPHLLEQEASVRSGHPVRGMKVVALRGPERLVGIDVPDSTNQVLIQQSALDIGVLGAQTTAPCELIKVRVEGIPRDVSNAEGDPSLVTTQATWVAIVGWDQLIDGKRAKDSLIDKTHLEGIATASSQVQKNPQMRSKI